MKNLLATRDYYKPFTFQQAFEFYEQSESMHWLATEVPMHQDVNDWKNKLTEPKKNLLTNVLRFFTQGDLDVAGAYVKTYLPLFELPEIRMMLLSFAARETVHIRAYSHLIDTLGMPETIFKQFHDYEVMRDKHEYFQNMLKGKWENQPEKNTMLQMATFSGFTEGMQLFSSFIMLLNFSRFNEMNGLGQIISWSILDEMLHCEGMTWLFREYVKEHRQHWDDEVKSAIYSSATTMIDMEDKFIDLSIGNTPEALDDLTADQLKQYTRYICDRRLIGLGLKGIFKVKKNPLLWAEEMINAPHHTSFFEQKNVSYSKSAYTGSWDNVWK